MFLKRGRGDRKTLISPLEDLVSISPIAFKGTILADYCQPLDQNFSTYRWLEGTCGEFGGFFIHGACSSGHEWAKEILCGREWCKVCGKDFSSYHMRRVYRWLDKVEQMRSMSYIVLTFPMEIRSEYRTRAAVNLAGKQVQHILKELGYPRGLRRWHLFGDKSDVWNPHLNIIVDGGWMRKRDLATLKQLWGFVIGYEGVPVVHVTARFEPGRMYNVLKYVTRSTFRDWRLDPEMALEFRGFHNSEVWGRKLWKGDRVWGIEDFSCDEGDCDEGDCDQEGDMGDMFDAKAVEDLQYGVCPDCGMPITWGGVKLPAKLLRMADTKSVTEVGAGYYRIERLERGRFRRKERKDGEECTD